MRRDTLVNAYGLNGMGKEALELFHGIPVDTIDEWIYVCVLNACSHSGLIDDAQKIFERIPNERRTEKMYTTLVIVDSIYLQQSLSERQRSRSMLSVVRFCSIGHCSSSMNSKNIDRRTFLCTVSFD
jgi:hypothetical protein